MVSSGSDPGLVVVAELEEDGSDPEGYLELRRIDPVAAAIAFRPSVEFYTKGQQKVNVAWLEAAISRWLDIRLDPYGSLYVYERGAWVPDDRRIRTVVAAWLGNRYVKGNSETVEDMLLGRSTLRLEDREDLHYVNFRNGMLELSSGELLPHDRVYGSMIQIPHDYDPEAPAPVRFLEFIDEISDGAGKILLLEALGYSLLDSNQYQKALILMGSGSNGKSVFLRLLGALVGSENRSSLTLDQIGEGFGSAHLYGKLLNIGDDLPGTHLKDVSTFKAVTGGGEIYADRKHRDGIEFISRAFSVFAANQIPTSSDAGSGYLRRWLPVRLLHFFNEEDQDEGLFDKLELEIPGIIPLAIDHLRRMLDRGGFSPLDPTDEAAFRHAVDPVRAYIEGKIELRPGKLLSRSELYKDYRAWSEQEGITHPVKASIFNDRLPQVFIERGEDPVTWHKSHGTDVWDGLTWIGSPPSLDRPDPM